MTPFTKGIDMAWKSLMGAAALAVVSVAPAQADDDALCGAYAAIGQAMASEMLDLTFRDVVSMMRGTNPAVMQQISNALINAVTGDEMAAMLQMSADDQALLGEAAGQQAMMILMSGQQESADGVGKSMEATCKSAGLQALLDQQRQVRSAMGIPGGIGG